MLAMLIIMVTGVLYVLSARNDPLVDVLSIGLTLTALTISIGERRSEFTDLGIIRFREAIGGMYDAVLILDSSLRVFYANRHGQELLDQNSDFIWSRMAARGLKISTGSNKWETALSVNVEPRQFILSTSDILREGKPIEAVLAQADLNGIRAESRLQGVELLTDPMLPNVFHCLADNTARHGGGGKTRNILVREEETEMGLSIIWEDDGVGVPFEQKQLIFTEGFGPNTGEGPFLAKEILSMTGLALSEGGEPGKGARYIVRAPSGSYTWRRTATS